IVLCSGLMMAWPPSVAAQQWRIDQTGTSICPPVERSVGYEQALRLIREPGSKWRLVYDAQGAFEGVSLSGPDPCRSPELAAQLDATPLPVCPPVDRSVSEDTAGRRHEPHVRITYDLNGKYEGVMHDAPDGPCRPRRADEQSMPPPPPR